MPPSKEGPPSMAAGPLRGCTVVSVEQAVAGPLCTARLAEMGARVIKIERPEGDFARDYDRAAAGVSAYFAWVNQGKESVVLDLQQSGDQAVLMQLLLGADVLVQNLKPGALSTLGFDSVTLQARLPRLITCDISGYGGAEGTGRLKAYDFLVQCESGMTAINGTPEQASRLGLPICDITAGLNAALGILGALLRRQATGTGCTLEVSLFDVAADLMTVPYLHEMYGAGAPQRQGLMHPTIAPYGTYDTRDGLQIAVSVQNDREWQRFCAFLLKDLGLDELQDFATNTLRVKHRAALENRVRSAFARLDLQEAADLLAEAGVAYAQLRTVRQMARHPALRTLPLQIGDRQVDMVASPVRSPWQQMQLFSPPEIGQHTQAIKAELGL